MTTRLYRVTIQITAFVAANSETDALTSPHLVFADDAETFGRPEPLQRRTAERVKSLEEVPEDMREVLPYGITDDEWCECCDLDEEDDPRLIDYEGRGMHLPECGYGLSCAELIAAQDRDRGIDGVTLPLIVNETGTNSEH